MSDERDSQKGKRSAGRAMAQEERRVSGHEATRMPPRAGSSRRHSLGGKNNMLSITTCSRKFEKIRDEE
jgi:hypothetical protein